MEQRIAELHAQIASLMTTIQRQQEELTQRLTSMEQRGFQQSVLFEQHEDIHLTINDVKVIDLELFKSISKFE